ncbi:MAG: hypothetical protein CSA24_01910 [Deltaproteobacteria bacterium]|nr:MAG: hypothetical protein CSA24_01910 [Deltaproteobacteria bacterium]
MKLGFSSPPAWRLLVCVAAIGLATSGCVEDVGLVDRSSPNKIDKKLFEGTWLYMTTTIDVPFSSAVSFVGEQPFLGGTRKVVFDLQEKWLIAYPVIESFEGTESDWKTHSIRKYWDPDHRDEFIELYVGPPVARWPVEKHFDVKRNYNAFNGAQSNEITENTVDRPWYQRDYVRIAWHQQGITDFFFSLRSGGESYYVGEEKPGDPDEMTLDYDGGYFDFVVRALATSAGQNRCSIYGLSPYDCTTAEVKVRHSFRRMDHRRDYEPIRYHNEEHQDRFGFFATERPSYDYDWGPSYLGQVAFADRWNLWMNTYDFVKPTDEAGAELTIGCMVDKDCDRAAGQRCQKDTGWFDEGYCATPVARPFDQRGLRPIIYHLSADWHEDYKEAAYLAADSWDDVFRDAVAWLLLYEEKGVARPRACESHADCANPHLLADVTVPVVYDGLPCHADTDCGTGTCDAGNYCAITRTCDASSPCAAGQTCTGGVCQEGGSPALRRLGSRTVRGSSVIYGNAATVVTHDNFSNAMRGALPSGAAYVRFVNLSPADGALGLSVGGTPIEGGAFDASLDYDPADPATAPFMAAIPAGSALDISVTSGGGNVASTSADIVANAQYIVAYNGADIIVAGAAFNASSRGIRLIHAANGESQLDFAVEGIRLAEGVAYRTATDYYSTAGANQRASVVRAGARGDISCFVDDTVGTCVGWSEDFGDADRDRQRQIKEGLPEMFVLCENRFDAIAASATFGSDAERRAHLGDARYTRNNGYNPCGDPALVPHPEALKKVGDARYSYFYWINEPQRSGPLGYGPSLADPETGQIIVGNANIYGGAIHTYAQYAADLLDLVNGDLDTSEVIAGDYIREYIQSKTQADDAEVEAVVGALSTVVDSGAGHDHDGHLHGLDLDARFDKYGKGIDTAYDRAKAMNLKAPRRQHQDWEFPELHEFMRDPEAYAARLKASLPAVDPAAFHERLGKVRGTWLEDLLINNEIRLAADYIDPNGEMSPDELQRALSPASWSSKYALEQERQRTQLFAKNNMYMGEFVDDALYGIAKDLKAQGYEGDALRLKVGQLILRGVLEHEVGHTVGLRHNFSGSTDVFNFFDEYYTIREQELILCQDQTWCDDTAGNVCATKACATDADCFAGTLCNSNVCSAPAADGTTTLVETGTCSTPVDDMPPCTQDQHCGAEGNICFENRCYSPREQFVPRSWMTDLEKANRRTEYQYTTIMDYGGRFNSDFQSLGKYDYAAIRYGYTQLVDVYEDTAVLDERIELVANQTGSSPAQYSFYKNARNWPTRGTGFFHAFNYLSNYIGVEGNLKRIPTPYYLVKGQTDMSVNDVREYLDLAYIEVPYAYCSDEFRGNMGCYYFDQGIDMGEMAAGATTSLEEYYIFDAFKRERLYYGRWGSPFGYYARLMDRYYRILGDVGMYYALYDNLLFRYSWYQQWKDMPLGGRGMEQAALTAFDTLKDVIAAPAPGSYKYDASVGAYTNISLESGAAGADFDVPFGVGRFPYTQFGSDLGYNYWEHPLWFGSFWEKLGALVTLTDSTAYFVDTAVGEQLDIGVGTSLGFNTVFASEMNNFLGGIVAGQLDFYAGREINDKYVPPSKSGRDVQHSPVEPALNNFTMKLYAALYGLAFLPAGFDPQFIDRLAVFLEGEATEYESGPGAGLPKYRFEDPIGGKVYVAYGTNYGEFGTEKLDAAAELVLRAQDLADDWADETDPAMKAEYARRMGEVREVLDVLRMLNNVYGTSTLGF